MQAGTHGLEAGRADDPSIAVNRHRRRLMWIVCVRRFGFISASHDRPGLNKLHYRSIHLSNAQTLGLKRVTRGDVGLAMIDWIEQTGVLNGGVFGVANSARLVFTRSCCFQAFAVSARLRFSDLTEVKKKT